MGPPRMRVALDARRLQDQPLGGVGRSLACMVDLLASEVDLVLLTDARRDPVATEVTQVALDVPRRAPETVWLQWCARSWLRSYDGVFHGTFNALPFRLPVPGVVTIHDLSFEVHPEGFGRAKRRLFQVHARYAARTAGSITVPSRHTEDELAQHYKVDRARVHVTPWAVEPRFGPARGGGAGPLLARLGVAGPYIVAMGGTPRRGLEVAVAAHRILRAAGSDVCLVVVGREAPPPGSGVVHAGGVDDDEWAALLAGAEAFCYPTRYEGFGFPALEGIASGTPVVCAPVTSLPEILGDAAEWCETPTAAAVAAGLRRVLDDAARAAELRARGLARAASHPTWEQAAEGTLRAYRQALGS